MFTFQDTRTPTTVTEVLETVDRHTAVIGSLLTAPFTYRKLTSTGLRKPRTKTAAAVVLGIVALANTGQRTVVVRDAVALDADSTPTWHTTGMLPLMVRSTSTGFPATARLGRTASGPVVVFDDQLLKIGSTTDQVAAYVKAAETEVTTRPEVAIAVFAVSHGLSRALRRVLAGAQPAPVSPRRAVAFLAADLTRTAVTAAALRALKRSSVNQHS